MGGNRPQGAGAPTRSSRSRLGGAGGTSLKVCCNASRGARPWPALKPSAVRLPPPTRAGGGSCWRSRRRARSRPASARFPPTLATPLRGHRRWATSCPLDAGRVRSVVFHPSWTKKRRVGEKKRKHKRNQTLRQLRGVQVLAALTALSTRRFRVFRVWFICSFPGFLVLVFSRGWVDCGVTVPLPQ